MSCLGARPSLDEVYHFAHSVIVVRAPIPRDQIALSPPRIFNGSFVEGGSLPLRSGVGRKSPHIAKGHSAVCKGEGGAPTEIDPDCRMRPTALRQLIWDIRLPLSAAIAALMSESTLL
jgi:hypothetical protein